MESININTTQNVQINYKVASVGERIVAVLLDWVFLLVLSISLAFGFSKLGVDGAILGVIVMIPVVFSSLLFELFMNGQTLGKLIMKIRVVTVDGGEASFIHYLIRWVFNLVDVLITSGICALLTVILNGEGQRLGDMLAGSCVVRISKPVELADTIFQDVPQEYEPVFSQVIALNDRDIALVKQVMQQYHNMEQSIERLQFSLHAQKKIKDRLGIVSNMQPMELFETLVKDYNYYAQNR